MSMNNHLSFTLDNIEEVEIFQNYLHEYMFETIGTSLSYINLVKAYEKLSKKENHHNRLFYAILDLKINFVLLAIDEFNTGAIWNKFCSSYSSDNAKITDNYKYFFGKMEVHKHFSNFIPRYRAIWDKIMGIIILFDSESKYEQYQHSKSKKKSFKNLTNDINFLSKDFAENVTNYLEKFDNTFRTNEMHNFGSLRKWSFLMTSFHKTPLIDLKNFWNWLLPMLVEIDNLINHIE